MCESFYSAASTDTFYMTKYFQPTTQSLLALFKEKHAASSVACSPHLHSKLQESSIGLHSITAWTLDYIEQ